MMDVNKGRKQIKKAMGRIDSLINDLSEGINALYQKQESNENTISYLQQENAQLDAERREANNLMKNLRSLKE